MRYSLVLVVICFLKSFQFVEITDVVKDLSLSAFCPYTQFCRNEPALNITNEYDRSCCAFCMCTRDCHFHGNCCPGIQHDLNKTFLQPVCYFPVYNANTETLSNYNSNIFTGIDSYNSFVTCPKTYTNKSIIEKCEGKQTYPEDLTVVSDLQDIVYRNKYCAKCHGIHTTIKWNLQIKCKTTKDLMGFRIDVGLETVGNCMIWSFPPEPGIGGNSKCYKSFDTCNITGKLPNYPALQDHHDAIQTACQAYTLYYFETIITKKRKTLRVFRNVHCFFCNAFNVFLEEFCPLQLLENRDIHDLKAVVAVINQTVLTAMKTNAGITKEGKCNKSQVYDPLFNTCRRLTCPSSYTASYGVCIESFVRTNGLSVSIPVEIWPVLKDGSFDSMAYRQDHFSTPNNLNELLEQMSKTIVKPEAKCKHCFTITNIPKHFDENNITAILSFRTTDKCSIDNLYSSLHIYVESSGNILILTNGNMTMRFKTVINYNYEMESSANDLSMDMNVCDHSHLYEDELYCPRITLNESEYNLLKTRGTFRGSVRQILQSCPDVDYITSNNMKDLADTHKTQNATCLYFDVCLHAYLIDVSKRHNGFKKQSPASSLVTMSIAVYLNMVCL